MSIKIKSGKLSYDVDYSISENELITAKKVVESYLNKNGSVAMTGDLNMDSHKIINVANPINNNDAATKSYVDAALAKIDQFKYVVSTTANNTPKDVVWYNGTTKITGILAASADIEYIIYLVPCKHTATEKQKGYDEYLAIKNNDTYSWELLGNTADIDLSSYLKVDGKMKLTDTYLNTISANTIVRSYQSGSGEYQEMVNNARVEDKNSDYQYRMNFDGEIDTAYIDYHLSKTGSIYNQITGENAYISNYITGNNASLTTKIEDYANVLLYAEGDSTSKTLKNAYIGRTKDGSRDGTPLFYLYNTDTDKYNTYGLAYDCSRNKLGYVILENEKVKITDIDFIDASDFNIENGSGTKSVQTKGENNSFDFTDKNANSGITGSVQYGAIGDYSFAINGNASAQGTRSFAQGNQTIAKGSVSHSEGENCVALANFSHAEGYATTSKGNVSHAEGNNTIAEGVQSHAEGVNTKATGYTSHAEGNNTTASGYYAHAEGTNTLASGENSKAVGYGCQATGTNSFAEGENTKATQYNSHAEGTLSQANAVGSHAAGYNTIANAQFQFAVGKFNNSLDTDLFQVGNGTADNNRKNAFRVLQDGRAKVQTAPSENDDITTKKYVDNLISAVKKNSFTLVDTTKYSTLNDFLKSTGEESYVYLYPINLSDLTKGYYQYIYENNAWVSLGTTQIDLSNYAKKTDLDTKIDITQKATANGVATLDSNGAIPNSQLPRYPKLDNLDINSKLTVIGEGVKIQDDNNDYTGVDNFSGADIDTTYYSKGINILNADDDTNYNLSFPAKDGTLATTDDIQESKYTYTYVNTTTYTTLDSFLATKGESQYIYLYPIDTTDTSKGYYKYVWLNNAWFLDGQNSLQLIKGNVEVVGDIIEKMEGYSIKGMNTWNIVNSEETIIAKITPTIIKIAKNGNTLHLIMIMECVGMVEGTSKNYLSTSALENRLATIVIPDEIANRITTLGTDRNIDCKVCLPYKDNWNVNKGNITAGITKSNKNLLINTVLDPRIIISSSDINNPFYYRYEITLLLSDNLLK